VMRDPSWPSQSRFTFHVSPGLTSDGRWLGGETAVGLVSAVIRTGEQTFGNVPQN
jgi:hypothetical protein